VPLLLQVYKLMAPHWAFTLQINANGRSRLISAEGLIERCFTPGEYALEVSQAEARSGSASDVLTAESLHGCRGPALLLVGHVPMLYNSNTFPVLYSGTTL
jgi:hypothetical protein